MTEPEKFLTRIRMALNRTWDAIAVDVLEVAHMTDGKRQVDRDQVQEMVLEFLRIYGGDKVAADYFFTLSKDAQQQIFNDVFKEEHYGY